MRNQLMKHNNQQGSVLVAVLCVVAIVALLASELASRQNLLLSLQKPERVKMTADRVRQKLMQLVYNNEAWAKSATDNCMLKGENCVSMASSKFIIKDSNDTAFYDSNLETSGFTLAGENCNAFDSNGSNDCPFHYDLNWQPVNCVGTLCDVQVTGTLNYKPSSSFLRFPFNENRYAFTMIRGKETDSLQHACNSLGGLFNQSTGACSTKPISENRCPAGQAMRTYKNTNDVVCEPVFDTVTPCPTGTAARGIRSDGSLECITL